MFSITREPPKELDARYWYYIWKSKGHERKGLADYNDFLDTKEIFHNKQACPIRIDLVQENQIIANIQVSERKLLVTPLLFPGKYYQIMTTTTPCNYGRHRYWFRCPACQKRCRKLYAFLQVCFFCRKCLNLGYRSQICLPWVRYSLMANKIERRLISMGGDLSQKPKAMRWTTFRQLQEKAWNYEMMAEEMIEICFLSNSTA